MARGASTSRGLRTIALGLGLGLLGLAMGDTEPRCVPLEPDGVVCVHHEDCGVGQYCEKALGDCDGEGRCVVQPLPCVIGLWAPQCGCDGVTYGNPCEASGAGVNVAHSGECADGCDTSKLRLTQANPEMYEFYELCVPAELSDPAAGLRIVDPTLYCGVAGVFVGCDRASEVGCHGELTYVPGSRRISDTKWAQLCALSLRDEVSRIGGGHFVQ